MAPLTLPPTFANSFWSQDYRSGLQVLYGKIEQGIAENEEIVNFIKARVRAERELAQTLGNPAPIEAQSGRGFGADDGASLYMAFRGLQHQSAAQGQAHGEIAKDLQEQVVDPFEVWSFRHAERIQASKEDILDGWLVRYETHIADVNKDRETYLTKCRKADEAEEDAKFAGLDGQQPQDTNLLTPDRTIRRTPSFAEKLSERLRRGASPSGRGPPRMASPKSTMEMFDAEPRSEKPIDGDNSADADAKSDGTATPTTTSPRVDKGKGKEISMSPTIMSPKQLTVEIPPVEQSKSSSSVTTHIVLGDASMPASDVSALLFRAQQEIGNRTVKFTLLGEYEHTFTGEDFVVWLKANVDGLKGSLDAATDAAKLLTEEYGALRRIGELGNKFDASPSAWFQFRPKAFNLQAALQKASLDSNSMGGGGSAPASHVDTAASSPIGAVSNGIKRSNTMVSSFLKTVQNIVPVGNAGGDPNEPPFVRARKEAVAADVAYRKAARQLDQHRCAVEEQIDEILRALQRWELERLKAVKTVLLQYQGIIASLNGPVGASNETSSVLISSFIPENDVKALIERYRTGPFRPDPKLYESVAHETEVSFGIDLRKWAGEGAFAPIRSIGSASELEDVISRNDLPPVLIALLDALKKSYGGVESDQGKRMTWIYEVPLQNVHHLRAILNGLPFDRPFDPVVFEGYDSPVLANTLKLWLLELNPPVMMWEGWDEVRKVYPAVGASQEDVSEGGQKSVEEELKNVLARLPMICVKVLDAVVGHLKELVDSTKSEESDEVYLTKVALSLGRSILRPKQETSMSIEAHHAHTFLVDLIKHYDTIFPATLERKKRESAARAAPKRKRTKMIDARQMRRSIDASANPRMILEAQYQMKNGPALAKPMSPPAIVTSESGGMLVEPGSGENTPSVKLEPPSPINLAGSPTTGFVPPPPPPPLPVNAVPPVVSPPAPPPAEIPSSPPSAGDVPLTSGPATVTRTGSHEGSRIRGPRVATPRGGGPRPLSLAAAAKPAVSAPTRSPRNSVSSSNGAVVGRSGSPIRTNALSSGGFARPRTPPDAKDYAPSKRGGRAAAGSFSRTRPSEP